LKLLTQHFLSAKLIDKCVMEDESYFTVGGNEWHQQSNYESEDHPATEGVKFICKTKFPAQVLLWMAVSERGISEPTMTCTYPIVYQYFINSSKDTTKMKKSCSGLIWHLHTTTIYFYTTQRIRWSD
jgi:hypothetical protein